MREKITKPTLALIIVSFCGSLFVSGGWTIALWSISIALLVFVIFVNGMYVVMPGHAGYKITLGKLAQKSYPAGFGWMIPFISSMNEVDVTRQTHSDTNTTKNANRREVTLKYVLTWRINPDEVHTLHSTLGEVEYVTKALCPQLRSCLTQVVTALSYEDINGKLQELANNVMSLYKTRIDDRLFKDVEINIVDVDFDPDYEKAVAEVAKVEMERKLVEEQAEQLKISARAKAEAVEIAAKAEAEALRIKGTSENEVREKLGVILKAHPELIREVLAKNFPKVYGGGVMPTMNLDDLLGK